MHLCLQDLVALTGGTLRLAAMPPRDGELCIIERIVLSAEAANGGDVFWCVSREGGDVELAFLRGALGVVAVGPMIEPWPGRFSLQIDDSIGCLSRLIEGLRGSVGLSFTDWPELKVLQLCAAGRVDIYPPTRQKCRMSKGKCQKRPVSG